MADACPALQLLVTRSDWGAPAAGAAGLEAQAAVGQGQACPAAGLYSLSVPPLPEDVAWALFQVLLHCPNLLSVTRC